MPCGDCLRRQLELEWAQAHLGRRPVSGVGMASGLPGHATLRLPWWSGWNWTKHGAWGLGCHTGDFFAWQLDGALARESQSALP